MKYFVSPPESRDSNAVPLTALEIRNAARQGTIEADTLLYPDNNQPPLTARAIIGTPPPLPPKTAAATPVKTKESMAWLWIAASVIGFCVLITVGGSLAAVHFVRKAEQAQLTDIPMAQERQAHQTKWIENDNYEPDGPPDKPDGKILELVQYPGEVGNLAAYISPDPGDGKKHPVMIWSKGGFGGIGDFFWDEPSRLNDQSARAFREAGIILMCPSYRGENDNPGKFELFYGEVDDFLAAVEYAKSLPYVDPDRVYLGGHSTGGTISLLAAATGVECRAIFSFGGEPDLVPIMADGEGYENTPYDINSEYDHKLRSPIRYTNFIKSPTFYIEGGSYLYSNDEAKKMERLAKLKEIPFRALVVEQADHFSILTSSTNLIAKKILEDTGETPISLTDEELETAWQQLNGISLSSELKRWINEGGELIPILENLESDIEVTSLAEITVVQNAITKALSGETDKSTDIAELAEICDYIDDEDLVTAFITRLGPNLRNYINSNFEKNARTEIGEENCMRIAGSLALAGDIKIVPVVSKLAIHEFAPENPNWEYIFEEIVGDTEVGKALVSSFQKSPPTGLIGDQLLTEVNQLLVEDNESIPVHPYNSRNGAAALAEMISENGNETFQATLALAFVDKEYRDELLPGVLTHPNLSIRLEAAWADAKHSGEAGIKVLQQACLDLEWSETAKGYLRELELEDKIPAASEKPNFSAKAKMVKWLKHPNEMGEVPATIDQIDRRNLYWPPEEKEIELRLFKFNYPAEEKGMFDTFFGIVGSTTWSSFMEYETSPDIPELYGHHCAIELNWNTDEDSPKLTAEEGLKILRNKNPGQLLKRPPLPQ